MRPRYCRDCCRRLDADAAPCPWCAALRAAGRLRPVSCLKCGVPLADPLHSYCSALCRDRHVMDAEPPKPVSTTRAKATDAALRRLVREAGR